jgi:hypothetical protein
MGGGTTVAAYAHWSLCFSARPPDPEALHCRPKEVIPGPGAPLDPVPSRGLPARASDRRSQMTHCACARGGADRRAGAPPSAWSRGCQAGWKRNGKEAGGKRAVVSSELVGPLLSVEPSCFEGLRGCQKLGFWVGEKSFLRDF